MEFKTNPNDLAFGAYSLSKREYFAAMAMQGILSANPIPKEGNGVFSTLDEYDPESIAIQAVSLADSLIKELNENN